MLLLHVLYNNDQELWRYTWYLCPPLRPAHPLEGSPRILDLLLSTIWQIFEELHLQAFLPNQLYQHIRL